MKKHFVIVNPIAGRGSAIKVVPEIRSRLHGLKVDFDLVLTDYPGQAIALAQDAGLNGYDLVVAAGGDGTVNEVINGLMHARKKGSRQTDLAVLPVGRGNDFAFSMGIPLGLEASCALLSEGNSRWIDVGFLKGGDFPEGRYFGNGVGIGFDAITSFEAAKLSGLISGVPAYIIAALKTIFLYFEAPILKLEIDDVIVLQPCLLVSIMNGVRLGGSFILAPESIADDGRFNLCIAQQVTRLQALGLFPKFLKGTQGNHPAIQMTTASRVNVTAISGSLPVHADGEKVCEAGEWLEVELLHKKLSLVC